MSPVEMGFDETVYIKQEKFGGGYQTAVKLNADVCFTRDYQQAVFKHCFKTDAAKWLSELEKMLKLGKTKIQNFNPGHAAGAYFQQGKTQPIT